MCNDLVKSFTTIYRDNIEFQTKRLAVNEMSATMPMEVKEEAAAVVPSVEPAVEPAVEPPVGPAVEPAVDAMLVVCAEQITKMDSSRMAKFRYFIFTVSKENQIR